MNKFEQLQDLAEKEDIEILEKQFSSDRIKGLYADSVIALNKRLGTTTEKMCVLAEELGHHYTSSGDILDLSVTENRKQERTARLWAYNHLIGLKRLIDAFEHGCHGRHEIAGYLDVTESFLDEAISVYREKYGTSTMVGDYVIYFEPLGVGLLKKFMRMIGMIYHSSAIFGSIICKKDKTNFTSSYPFTVHLLLLTYLEILLYQRTHSLIYPIHHKS